MTDAPTALSPEELAARVGWPHESGLRLCGEKDIATAIRQHSEAQARQIEALTADNEQLNATFDLRHKADARAIKQWQEVTGRTMSMPDQADLCVFLMMALDMSEARATTAEAALAAVTAERDDARGGEQEEIATAETARSQSEKDAAALHVVCHDRDEWKARATTAEATLSASLERVRVMREALSVAYDLSTWAACINWRARNKDNQGKWLDELRGLIAHTQQLVEPLLKQQPAALTTQEATDER